MEKFPKTYIGRYPTAASLTAGRTRVMSLARSVAPTNNWAFVEETNTIWAQNKDGEWIDTGKAFIRTDTFKGNPLIADGTVNWEMQGLKVFGKSKQASTTGAQLLKLPEQVIATRCTYTTDGTEITMDTTGADAYVGTIQNVSVAVDPIRSFIVDVSGKSTIYCYIENSTFNKNYVAFLDENYIVMTGYFAVPSSRSIEVPSGYKYACFRFGVSDSVEGTRYKTKIMINAGSTASPWEPYTGGMPSPNPEYPQEIVSTGDDGQIGVTVCGANLANINSPNSYTDPNGIFMQSFNYNSCIVPTRGVSRLYVDCNFKLLNLQTLRIGLFDEFPEYGIKGTRLNLRESGTMETNSANYVVFSILPEVNYKLEDILNTMIISYGDLPVSYIPYQSQLFPIPTPNGLPGIPVDSGGNYTDETGQQWICDYVDFARGVKVQNCFSLTIYDFSSSGVYQPPVNGYTNGNFRLPYPASTNYIMHSLCDKFKYLDSGSTIKFNMSNLFIYFMIKGELNKNQWKEKMTELSPTVIYPLETPIETPLSSEELVAYQALTSYDGATNIFSDEEVGLEADLVTDKIDKDGYADPSAELSLYYAALAGFVSLSDVPMPSCRESELVRKLIDPEFELSFEVNDSSSRKEKYLWDLINGTTKMLSNNPLSNTEKFLHIMLGGEVSEYPVVHSELEYWMDVCATFYGKI